MSGNPDEMPADRSSRLRDRARSGLAQARARAAEGSTRLRDRATSTFQRRRQQAAQAEAAIRDRTAQAADALDLRPGDIEPVQLDDRGEDIGFVPDESGRDALAERFADARPFVDPADVAVAADPREGVRTRTDPAATDDIAADAAADIAAEDRFTEPRDLGVEVGPGGVEDVDVTEPGEQRIAARQFEARTPLEEVDPTADLRETDAGFGLAREPAREAAAAELDRQVEAVDIGPDDITLEATDAGGFDARFEGDRR